MDFHSAFAVLSFLSFAVALAYASRPTRSYESGKMKRWAVVVMTAFMVVYTMH